MGRLSCHLEHVEMDESLLIGPPSRILMARSTLRTTPLLPSCSRFRRAWFAFVVFSMALLFHSKLSHTTHAECQAFECTDYDVRTCELAQVAYCQSRATISQYVRIKGEGGKKHHGNGKEGPSNSSMNTHTLHSDPSVLICSAFFSC